MTTEELPVPAALAQTGERTVPGVPAENYWFRRHEVAYLTLAGRCAGARVLEAGCGEGYGARVLADAGAQVIALDYDGPSVRHVAACYPQPMPVQGDLSRLPVRAASVDVVASLQVIEHLTDQAGFLDDCARVLRPGGQLLVTTPNRITFSPGGKTPLNPFHTRELSPRELRELVCSAGFSLCGMLGVHHGPRLRELDARHGGSLIGAQLAALLGSLPGQGTLPPGLLADVASVRAEDFAVHGDDLDASLDLIAIAVRR